MCPRVCVWAKAAFEMEGGLSSLKNPPQFLAVTVGSGGGCWWKRQQQADFHEKRASVGLMEWAALCGDKWQLITAKNRKSCNPFSLHCFTFCEPGWARKEGVRGEGRGAEQKRWPREERTTGSCENLCFVLFFFLHWKAVRGLLVFVVFSRWRHTREVYEEVKWKMRREAAIASQNEFVDLCCEHIWFRCLHACIPCHGTVKNCKPCLTFSQEVMFVAAFFYFLSSITLKPCPLFLLNYVHCWRAGVSLAVYNLFADPN